MYICMCGITSFVMPTVCHQYNKYPKHYQSESFVWREQSKLQSERELFVEQKRDFENDKQKFMEAVRREVQYTLII